MSTDTQNRQPVKDGVNMYLSRPLANEKIGNLMNYEPPAYSRMKIHDRGVWLGVETVYGVRKAQVVVF